MPQRVEVAVVAEAFFSEDCVGKTAGRYFVLVQRPLRDKLDLRRQPTADVDERAGNGGAVTAR